MTNGLKIQHHVFELVIYSFHTLFWTIKRIFVNVALQYKHGSTHIKVQKQMWNGRNAEMRRQSTPSGPR